MVSEVFKVCERYGGIRYSGALDTCADFNIRGMASELLSRSRFTCLFNRVQSTILLKSR